VPRGGKRAGAGRRPTHGKRKSSYFASRITPDLRADLEREANHRGHSLSQEIERRLRDSVQSESKKVWGGDRNRGLALLVNRLAQTVEAYAGETWVTNDYTFRALRGGLEKLLTILDVEKAPPGRGTDLPQRVEQMIKSSEQRGRTFRLMTPEECGQFFADGIWTQVMTLEMPSDLSSTTDEFRVLARMRGMLGIKAVEDRAITKRRHKSNAAASQ
jgi:hypothetical protein